MIRISKRVTGVQFDCATGLYKIKHLTGGFSYYELKISDDRDLIQELLEGFARLPIHVLRSLELQSEGEG